MVTNPRLVPFAIASTTGELADANQIIVAQDNLTGVAAGAANAQAALERVDGTGVGASIFTFTGNFTAQASNLDDWFGGRQQTRLRCTDSAGVVPPTFRLPATAALNTAFNQLVAAGLPEVIRLLIEYTGPSSTNLNIVPRDSVAGTPQISGTSRIIVRSGTVATLEITRSGATISDFIFQSVTTVGENAGASLNAVRLISPSEQTWDASANGTLPSTAVVKGNAYKVVNAPIDGSGRFGEVMQDGDWVVWEGATFTSWSAVPVQWFVLPAHDVRRITALEDDFLTDTQISPVSSRNTIIRGADYADSAGEIRLKIYTTRAGYSAADLNTTGIIDAYQNAADITGFMAIRLSGELPSLVDVLPTLYLYVEDSDGTFTRLLNLADDFTHEGNFNGESDYLALRSITYSVGDTMRIYLGTVEDRYNNPSFDVFEANLVGDVQSKLNRQDPASRAETAKVNANEAKIDALFPLTPDVEILTGFSDIFDPQVTVQRVDESSGNSLFIDYRGASARYESTGITYDASGTNVVRYTGLGTNDFRAFGFSVSGPSNRVLMSVLDGTDVVPYIDITAAGQLRVNDFTPAQDVDERQNPGGFSPNDPNHPPVPLGEDISGDGIGSTFLVPGDTSSRRRFPLANFPTGSTQQSRRIEVVFELQEANGQTGLARVVTLDLPAGNTAQATRVIIVSTFDSSGARLNAVIEYELTVQGGQLNIEFHATRSSENVASVRFHSIRLYRAYTATVAEPRVDNYRALETSGGAFNFTGAHEFLFSLAPSTQTGTLQLNAVGLITATGQIDLFLSIDVHKITAEFSTVEIPDQAAFAGFEFRSWLPDHPLSRRNIEDLLGRRTVQWVYGLARLFTMTEHAFSAQVDFPQGIVLTSPDASRWLISIDNAGVISGTKLP